MRPSVRLVESHGDMTVIVETRVDGGVWQTICDERGQSIDLLEGAQDPDWRPDWRAPDDALRHFERVQAVFRGME